MKKTNCIRIFSVILVAGALLIGRTVFPLKEQESPLENKTDMVENNKADETEVKVTEEDVAVEELLKPESYDFVIVAEEGYLTVYQSDLETVYEYTDIQLDELNEEVKEKVNKGYCIKDLEELFNFLENYSS